MSIALENELVELKEEIAWLNSVIICHESKQEALDSVIQDLHCDNDELRDRIEELEEGE